MSLEQNFSENVSDFWVQSKIKYINNPTEVEFLRECVSAFVPAIFTNAVHWPALSKWNLEYLEHVCKGSYSINVTADGKGDAVKSVDGEMCFIYPAEVNMSMTQFCEMLRTKCPDDAVPYLSQQDSNLLKHFPELLVDIEQGIRFADSSFGSSIPEAVNLWIGDERSTSSLHKDYFENLYVVVSGVKTFTLYPPTDVVYFVEKTYPTLRYLNSNASCGRIKQSDLSTTREDCPFASLSWIDYDPDNADTVVTNPMASLAHPVHCTVRAGEILYIPAMWYHQVSQTEITIAVNFWYEQRFDFRYVFFEMAKSLSASSKDLARSLAGDPHCNSLPEVSQEQQPPPEGKS